MRNATEGVPRFGTPRRAFPTANVLPALLLHALLPGHGLARALAGPGVGSRALAAHRQAAAVARAAIATDVLEALDVLLHLAAQGALDHVLAIEDGGQAGNF